MKKFINQFSAGLKNNILVFLTFPFVWTSCARDNSLSSENSNISPNAAVRAAVTGTTKANIKLFSFTEVNDTNPLNNLNFTLKNSGKPLIDIVVLFSANINYDAANDKVFVSNNPNVQHLLTNRTKYLKPLQDKGIKVILSILGNHDRSGIANLSTTRAKAFAQELKNTCDLYNLDGVFFDDEYSAYQTPPPSGFVTPSNNAAARLAYETKQAMPNKLVTVYVYSRTSSFPNTVDGVKAGSYVDYAIHDYGGSYDLATNYPGLAKSGMVMSSQEFNQGRYATAQALRNIVTKGYGGHMIFAMDPNRSNFTSGQLPALKLIAKELYGDELVYSNTPYSKDW
ncbi:endo-beta-N-acetylglucosaminidase F1 [Elizabethkingia anophelis]|uniref:endo-beta-N-acetylglucosaminidase F1 n=1 Tax=Elizabethkingia anophelis TaxID=1117645 RepID=UPI000442B317|nr:endo-beta-N-acetylglucosaminidase F1 [Elizabethkingia anophelis]AVF48183.1 endo-beta-N-acetylglucosaminidase [Elizabethkingia anophelis]AVF52177.1 endo-beta-N-acetylglucosaminidase [Elizabethkingia anophelis]EJC8061522.1 endo-beta-N-acetylglucosaminidase [Elizabethkingia anophelis]EJC8062256.1 endo-beta-N-acetylglucosaminidase [Elizabethkingia anophelis]MBG0505806.1 endo-beta-N-acetylglucosaminidase [Elizabethkingia anophelis]